MHLRAVIPGPLFTRNNLRRQMALVAGITWITMLQAQWQQVQFDDSDMALDLTEAFTFQKYPTYTQYVEMMQLMAAENPEICKLDTFGTSEEGRLLLALKISGNVKQDEPEARFLYTSTMHGDELVGFILTLRLAQTLLTNYGKDNEVTRLVDSLAIWINPMANPDGSYSVDQGMSLTQSVRVNTKGIDLNRNFPDPAKGESDDTTGLALENKYMMQFMKQHGFTMSANFHAGAEVVNYPWDHTDELHADDSWYRFIAREYADEARAKNPDYMALFTDGISNGAQWYVIEGGRQDYVNFYLGCREVTLEVSNQPRLGSGLLEEHWEFNHRSMINYMAQCMYGIRGRVTDKESGEPIRALVRILDYDSTYSVIYSNALHGNFYRLIKEGDYDMIFAAPGYLTDTLTGVSVTDYEATYLEVRLERGAATGLSADLMLPAVTLYPNPSVQNLFVKPVNAAPGPMELRVFSMDGLQQFSQTYLYRGESLVLPVGLLPQGIYILRATSEEFDTSLRFIKQ